MKKAEWDTLTTEEKFRLEFQRGVKQFANNNRTHKYDHLDLQSYMWNEYEEHIKRLREKQSFWETEVMQKYLKS